MVAVIWHEPHRNARATALPEHVLAYSLPALARLIASLVLRDTGRTVIIDHVLHVPVDGDLARILGPALRPAEIERVLARVPEDAGGRVPVADPGTGTVDVMARRCDTCIYRRAMRRAIGGGRIDALIADALAIDGHVVCHETLPEHQGPNGQLPFAICHGFAAAHPACTALRAAGAFGRIRHIEPAPAAGDER